MVKEGEVWGFTDKELKKMISNKGFVLAKKSSFMWRLNKPICL